ncbi:MAG: hypothetical protein ACI88A_001159 [Paraglaciecola sp.]|jgi:hypothetical protein
MLMAITQINSIPLIRPLADSKADMNSSWIAASERITQPLSLFGGIEVRAGNDDADEIVQL